MSVLLQVFLTKNLRHLHFLIALMLCGLIITLFNFFHGNANQRYIFMPCFSYCRKIRNSGCCIYSLSLSFYISSNFCYAFISCNSIFYLFTFQLMLVNFEVLLVLVSPDLPVRMRIRTLLYTGCWVCTLLYPLSL